MSENINKNHYIPVSLLKRFANPVDENGSLIRHGPHRENSITLTPRKLAFETKLYGKDRNKVESNLSIIENDFVSYIRIQKADEILEQREIISRYVSIQCARIPKSRKILNDFFEIYGKAFQEVNKPSFLLSQKTEMVAMLRRERPNLNRASRRRLIKDQSRKIKHQYDPDNANRLMDDIKRALAEKMNKII